MLEIIEKYQEELKDHLTIDEFNLKDTQLQLAGRKHIWVGRLMRHKHELNTLQRQKKEKLASLTKQVQEQSNVRLSSPAAEKVAQNSNTISTINEQIESALLCIDYLERVEKILSSVGFDLKNIVEINKLETTI